MKTDSFKLGMAIGALEAVLLWNVQKGLKEKLRRF